MENRITDKDVMQVILDNHKQMACSLTQFALECNNFELRNEVLRCLDMTLFHQHHIYELMKQQGWYQPTAATPGQVDAVKNMLSQTTLTANM